MSINTDSFGVAILSTYLCLNAGQEKTRPLTACLGDDDDDDENENEDQDQDKDQDEDDDDDDDDDDADADADDDAGDENAV